MKLFRFRIQVGNYPNISHYCASPAVYWTRDQAEVAAFDYLLSLGYEATKISRKWIHTNQERAVRDWRTHGQRVFIPEAPRERRPMMALKPSVCGRDHGEFAMFSGYTDEYGVFHRVWGDDALKAAGGVV